MEFSTLSTGFSTGKIKNSPANRGFAGEFLKFQQDPTGGCGKNLVYRTTLKKKLCRENALVFLTHICALTVGIHLQNPVFGKLPAQIDLLPFLGL